MFGPSSAEQTARGTSAARGDRPGDDAAQPAKEINLNMLLTEMIFCVALALTTYGALHNTPTKISKHPQAVRFFGEESVVTDWYRGQLTQALAAVNREDISFVMYYAPWDAESQYVRGEFEKAAQVLSDRVYFTAINCWHPGSECRLQHNKIPSWPILMAYTVTSKGILYKGPKDAHSMVHFLEIIMKPLNRVSSTEDLIHLLSYCDAVAVGYTPLSETSAYYNTWYSVSLKAREYDVVGEICFAAVTSADLALDLGVEILPNARMMLWNDTKEYVSDETSKSAWNESSLMVWVLENFAQPVARIIPLWKKAFNFERYVDGNPILIMFTPLNPIYELLPYYALMREVAMEYYSCKNNASGAAAWTAELVQLQRAQRLLYQQTDHHSFCRDLDFEKPLIKRQSIRKDVESNAPYPWTNSTQRVPKSGVWDDLFGKRGVGLSDPGSEPALDWVRECGARSFPAEPRQYERHERCGLLRHSLPHTLQLHDDDVESSMLPLEDDPLSPHNLVRDNVRHFCALEQFAREFSAPLAPPAEHGTHVRGLACAHNFTLHMLAIDSVRNHHFAESLGIDVLNASDMTAVVILDSQHESQYLLSEQVSDKSLREFIYNFTNKSLKRSLRSDVGQSAHTHYFATHGTHLAHDTHAAHDTHVANDTVYIEDLTTRSFRRLVRTPGPLSIVCVCGGRCGASVARAAAGAARLLARAGLRAAAARLDAARHDLPWHYTLHALPAIFVFPPDRGGLTESVMYPRTRRITSAGVTALALRSLGAPAHLRVRLALCTLTRSNAEKRSCLRDIREHVSGLIERNLRYWRRGELCALRRALMRRLRGLRALELRLGVLHAADLAEPAGQGAPPSQAAVLHVLDSLAAAWDVDVAALAATASNGTRSSCEPS